MGASVGGYCRDMSEELHDQPGFWNDCKAWGDWMAEREKHPATLKAIRDLGCAALLSFITDGVAEKDVAWVTPQALSDAALALRKLVQAGDPRTRPILDSYRENANGVDPVESEFAQDLEDVSKIANYFKARGVKEMTLSVNW